MLKHIWQLSGFIWKICFLNFHTFPVSLPILTLTLTLTVTLRLQDISTSFRHKLSSLGDTVIAAAVSQKILTLSLDINYKLLILNFFKKEFLDF